MIYFKFPWDRIGITEVGMSYLGTIAVSDGGNGIVQTNLHYGNGNITSVDVITKTSGGNIPAGSTLFYLIDIGVVTEQMLDSACDKFYWKKTA